GGDVAKTVALQHDVECVARRTYCRFLAGGRPVDRAAVLRAEVVALTEALRRIVVLPERLEQQFRRGTRAVRDEHRLGVSRATATHLLVCRIGGVAPHVSDRGGHHAGQLPEDAFGTPETTHRDVQDFDAYWPGTEH